LRHVTIVARQRIGIHLTRKGHTLAPARNRQTAKQQNVSRLRIENPFGLKGSFYELENKELVCIFTPSEMHQSYPGRLHGGITTAILDETIAGRS